MEKFVRTDDAVSKVLQRKNAEWILTPNDEPRGSTRESNARHHGDFDNDDATLRAVLARILGRRNGGSSPPLMRHQDPGPVVENKLAAIASASAMQVRRS
ncbi:MAG TPA: hypothetical protein VJ719_00255, partial [Chthoniobacterales bacterium]|nr:hypothetical protein [Chthoniobacterales bacterium]